MTKFLFAILHNILLSRHIVVTVNTKPCHQTKGQLSETLNFTINQRKKLQIKSI